MAPSRTVRHLIARGSPAAVLAAVLVLGSTGAAHADTVIDGPIDLGSAEAFGVLGSSTVTNTGETVITGDVGVSPGTEITGFPPGVLLPGSAYAPDTVAAGRADLTTAYGVASSLTPTVSGLSDLAGQSLVPGVYAGETLSLTGSLTLTGNADSVWVFQSASTLITSSGSTVLITGGASSCNVFWRVGSSATLGTASTIVGTVMADVSITAETGATIQGRLLARTGAVTLDSNTITRPASCVIGDVGVSPVFTSSPAPTAVVGTAYGSSVVASGTPAPGYAVTGGALPDGLSLDVSTGAITGTATEVGTFAFTVTAGNGVPPDAVGAFTITVGAVSGAPTAGAPDAARLPATGDDALGSSTVAVAALVLGFALVVTAVRRRRRLR